MKKLIVVISAVALITVSSFAQRSGSDFMTTPLFGFKAGSNYSNVYDVRGEEFVSDPKFGFVTGVFASIPIGKFLGVQPEILFSQKGFKGSGRILNNTYSFTRTTSFIDVPLMFALKPMPFVTLLAGPQYSYLLKQKDVFATGGSTIEQQQEFQNENIRKNILGFTGGLDINVNHIVIGARAGWDLRKNHGDGSSTTPRYRNVWMQATLGYRF